MPASYDWGVEHIGRLGDGGKWVCGMSQCEDYAKDRECVMYSFGVRDESSFEQEMPSRTDCVVWVYDFSVKDFGSQVDSKHHDQAHFKQIGIAGTTDTTLFYSIADLMEMNGHDYIDILKMDIDEAKYDALDSLHRDFPASTGEELPIGQLMVEIHIYDNKNSMIVLDWWERLEARGLCSA
ncbi:hypothetical protein CGRA01v4_12212 [Colletotrichum graminicola]|uniref:Methyltransferase domain-containing protein n=1 Tax=Colletotrichum graminicola (strain M1.001 / M2 / FGSC 10212) TaxID=645133 RepID=E3QZS2_COLGM|nr:uncharacterized protein GLRG_11505 [Colletotrichum graminicola M1.001]EFQ36360.1 hypothetical protein GLRG_11505 [Colletotrichum graminicola M1.001]WDK20923.1 hypothetical protein CGRA01v4_12212 [Colletotrichum graminicola]